MKTLKLRDVASNILMVVLNYFHLNWVTIGNNLYLFCSRTKVTPRPWLSKVCPSKVLRSFVVLVMDMFLIDIDIAFILSLCCDQIAFEYNQYWISDMFIYHRTASVYLYIAFRICLTVKNNEAAVLWPESHFYSVLKHSKVILFQKCN